MTNVGPSVRIGETFEDMLIMAMPGDEYLGCKFLRCEIFYKTGAKFYDCDFTDCPIHIPPEGQ